MATELTREEDYAQPPAPGTEVIPRDPSVPEDYYAGPDQDRLFARLSAAENGDTSVIAKTPLSGVSFSSIGVNPGLLRNKKLSPMDQTQQQVTQDAQLFNLNPVLELTERSRILLVLDGFKLAFDVFNLNFDDAPFITFFFDAAKLGIELDLKKSVKIIHEDKSYSCAAIGVVHPNKRGDLKSVSLLIFVIEN